MLLQNQDPVALREEIQKIMVDNGFKRECYSKILDYTVNLFESKGLGIDYYGYHNIIHELEVTYVTLLAAQSENTHSILRPEDFPYLFVASLFHDYDPQKKVDKPHEEDAVKFVMTDEKLDSLLRDANIDKNLIAVLIHRTTYPWSGEIREVTEKKIEDCLNLSEITRDDKDKRDHFKKVGWFLSVTDRIAGYSLGDFSKALEMAQKNAHALAWHPYYIVRRSVAYFEDLFNNDAEMYQNVLQALPKDMRKHFTENVLSFMKLREQEIQIEGSLVYDNTKFFAVIEPMSNRQEPGFIDILSEIYKQLPKPLQFKKDDFVESVMEKDTILNTLRLGSDNGPVIGFTKGGPLEAYKLRPEINDVNHGLKNTAFMEPLAIRMGYWGQRGGREMRLLFNMQAQSKGYKYLTSFALRDVIASRIERNEQIEFVKQFDPERWDYYRIVLQ
ncbi:MAG: HD domain-containing protein [Nitrosotalea sp.]